MDQSIYISDPKKTGSVLIQEPIWLNFLLLKVSDEVGGFKELLFRWFEFSTWSPAILTVARISKGMGRKEHLFPWFCGSGRTLFTKRYPEVGGDSGSW